MRLPACFQSNYIARNVSAAEFSSECQRTIIRGARFRPVPEAEPPLRRHVPPTREYVVAPDSVEHGWSREKVDVYTRRTRYLDGDLTALGLRRTVRIVRISAPCRNRGSRRGRLGSRISEVEGCVTVPCRRALRRPQL